MNAEETDIEHKQNPSNAEAFGNSNTEYVDVTGCELNPDFSNENDNSNDYTELHDIHIQAAIETVELEEVFINAPENAKNEFVCELCDRSFSSLSGLKRHRFACEKHRIEVTKRELENCAEIELESDVYSEDEGFLLPNVVVLVDEEKAIKMEPVENESEQFPCLHCDQVFSSSSDLKRHTRTSEKIKNKFIVEKNTIGVQKEVLGLRISVNEGHEYILPDELDERQGSVKESVLTGIDKSTVHSESSFFQSGKCDCCGQGLDTAHTERKFECTDCSLFFTSKRALTGHRTVIHNEEETFKCSKCGLMYSDKRSLNYHMRTHDLNERKLSCPVCHKQFKRKYHLVRHNMQTGCDGSERPTFPCQICTRVFTRKDNLNEHLRAHSGETKRKQRYHCKVCNEMFTGMVALSQHKKLHLGEKPYSCDLCEKRFSTTRSLKKHRRTHTGERPYECMQCLARFAAKETLNRHVRTHTGDKPHSCEICGKSFIQAAQLRSHLFRHTGENGYICDTCGKAFDRRNRLTAHIKVTHLK